MNEIMTLAEIKSKFDSEWILIGDPETTLDLEIERGIVLWHSSSRDEVYRKVRELGRKHWAVWYTGSIPKGAAVVL